MLASTVTTEPNTTPVSPNWKQRTYAQKEVTEQGDDKLNGIPWWRDRVPGDALCSIRHTAQGEVAILSMEITGEPREALLDSGASLSFINPAVVESLGLRTTGLNSAHQFTIANGESIKVDKAVYALTTVCNGFCFTGDYLIGPIPYDLLLGLDWLKRHEITWRFSTNTLHATINGEVCQLPVVCKTGLPILSKTKTSKAIATPAEDAYHALAQQVSQMTTEEASSLLRPPPKRYKTRCKAKARVRIDELVRKAHDSTSNLQSAADGLNAILAMPKDYQQPSQSQMLCALLQQELVPTNSSTEPNGPQVKAQTEVDEESTWQSAPLQYTHFDRWLQSDSAQSLPSDVFELLKSHRLLFPDTLPPGLPPKRPYDHHILLVPGKLPAKGAVYKMPPDQLPFHKQELAKLLDHGWIGPTHSPICAPVIMVNKRDDGTGEKKMRMVVNYQELNKLTIAPDFPMPSVQTILDMLGGAKFFSTLDLEAGFHQIRMAREDRWKTAFRSALGLFEYKVMPFGLKGAPATFQANINAYLQPLLGQGVIAYLDDVLIYSPDLSSHVQLLQIVLDIFLQHQFYPKFSKCKFAQTQLDYLGYRISAEGIKPSPDKVEAISLWPEVLTNDTQVRQFLGTANYCRMFMGPRFADISRPLVELTKKGVTFAWGPQHTEAVRQLKQQLVNSTTLQIPDPKKPYQLYTDASGYAIGAVLEQENFPVAFFSRVMTPAQQKYCIYDQELLALVTALDRWKHLLANSTVTAYTDHQALTHLQHIRNNKPLRGRTARWLDFLAEFPNLTISYLQGSSNKVADAMSRHPAHTSVSTNCSSTHSSTLTVCAASSRYTTRGHRRNYRADAGIRSRRSSVPVTPPSPSPPPSPSSDQPVDSLDPSSLTDAAPLSPADWENAYTKCKEFAVPFAAAKQQAGEPVSLEFHHRKHSFRFISPHLHICIHGLWRICVPTLPEFMSHVLYRNHDHVTAGHRGEKKTYRALSRHYYWPGMHTYTTEYVASCVECRRSKSLSRKPAGLLQPLFIPSRRWSHVSLDFITDLPRTTAGHDCILVLVDSLSKMAHFIPTHKSATALDTVDLLADRLIRYHGFPDMLISDRDPRFQSEVWEQLCNRFSIKRALSSPYHPQSDGQTERLNRTLEQMLRTYIQSDERAWESLLPALELAYNTTSHSSTELSPFEVMIGQNPVTAADIDIVGPLSPTLTPPMTKLFRRLCDRAQAHILRAKWSQKSYYDAKHRDVEYAVGDKVWISSRHLPTDSSCSKFTPRYLGPFPILERIGQVAYRIQLPSSYSCHDVFHVSLLVKDRPRDPSMNAKEAAVGWLPVNDAHGNPTDQYQVDYIMGQRGTGDSAFYLVKWRGYPEDRATWEPAANLANCSAFLRAWRRRLRKHQRSQQVLRPQDSPSSTADSVPQ